MFEKEMRYFQRENEAALEPIAEAETKYEQYHAKIQGMIPSKSIDLHLCADIKGLVVGLSLKLPQLPALPVLPGFHLPEVSISCLPSVPDLSALIPKVNVS